MYKESDGLYSVKCPICGKELKLITMTHLKTHNYSCKEDFLKEYPNAQLVSKDYEERNRILRRRVFTELNKSPEQRVKASLHAKKLNQDYYHQSTAGKAGWTPERRKEKSDLLKSIAWDLNNLPEYEDYRKRRQKGLVMVKEFLIN